MIKLDKQVILQIFGSLMKEPIFLGQVDLYNLTPDDFSTLFDKQIFGAIYNLFINGAKRISSIDIDMYLSDKPVIYKNFQNNNGLEYLQDAESIANEQNFNYYYTKLKKYNALKDLNKIGINTSFLYPDNDLILENQDPLIEKFESLSVADIFNSIKAKISEKEIKYNCATVEVEKANFGIHSLLSDLKESPEIGIPLQGEIYNTVTKGALKTKYHLFSAGSGVGKALLNSTIIPTPNGYKKVGEIKTGDYLFDSFGKPTKVLSIYPQGLKDVWEVTFKSGRKAKCNDEHLWSFCTQGQRDENKDNRVFYTKTLKEISEMKLQNKKGAYQILIPNAAAVSYTEKSHYIPSYIFGLALGDGSFRHSYNKFIPKDYLFDSIENRLDLLNGLLDSDGSVDKRGRVFYYTISPLLRDNVIELCEGLGYTTSIIIDTHKGTNPLYKISIIGRPQDKLKLFKLDRKHSKIVEWYNSSKRKEKNDFDPIIKIENLNYKEEMTCFYVDNEEHLFLMNNYIVTHNTRRMVGDACFLAYPIRYNVKKNMWEKTGHSEKVMYVATEQKAKEIKPMILAYLSDINEDVIKYNMYTKEEGQRLEIAMKIMDTYEENLTIGRLPEPNISQVKTLFRTYALREQIEYFFYDYIFTTPSLLNEFRDISLRNDQLLRILSTELKNLAEELNIYVMSATQITGDLKEVKGIRNELLLRDSKSIPDKADACSIVARVTPEELNLLSKCTSMSGIKPTQVTDVYKNRGGRFYEVRIWSYVDLGTLHKQDLFITDAYYNEVYGYQTLSFTFEEDEEEYIKANNLLININSTEKKESPLSVTSVSRKTNNDTNWDLLI